MAQLKSTNITGNLAVTGNILASKIIKLGGTSDQILLANGDVATLSNLGAGNVTGSSLTNNTIILGGGSSSIKSSNITIATPIGTDDTTVPTSKAVKDYVTGLGYITGYTLPLADNGTRGGIQIGYNASGANLSVQLSNEKAYVALTKGAITSGLGYTPLTDGAGDLAFASGTNWSSLSIGKVSKNGILTLYKDNTYMDIKVDGTLSSKAELKIPTSGGTIATQSWVTEQLGAGGSGSNSEWAKFFKPQDGATSNGASTWTSSPVGSNWKRGWSQRFAHSNISSDTGDINFWLRPSTYTSNATELCVVIDGDFYGHTGSKRVAYEDDIPPVNDGTLTMATSGTGISGSATFTANQSDASKFTVTLNSSTAGNRSANQVVLAAATGQINSTKYAITNAATVKASWQYNSTTDCIELVWA